MEYKMALFFSSCYDYAEVNWINDVTHKRENEFNISFDVARTMDTQGLLLVCLDVGSQSAVVSKRIAALARPANVNPIFHLDRLSAFELTATIEQLSE